MACASRRPAPPLDAFIETLWTSERTTAAAHAREWNLPTGRADLVVPLTQGALHRAAPDPWVGWAVRQLAAAPNRVGEVQRASGCSPSRFIERYRAGCGLAPKRHAALMRFNALLQAASGAAGTAVPGWAEVAYFAGYADQAHMSREFRRFAELSPGDYRRAATAFSSHAVCR